VEMCTWNNCFRWVTCSSYGGVCTVNFLAILSISACSLFSLSQTPEPKERLSSGNKSCSSVLKWSFSDSPRRVKSVVSPEPSLTTNFAFVLNCSKSRVIALWSLLSRTVSLESLSALTVSGSHRVCGLTFLAGCSVVVFECTKDCSSQKS